MMNLIIYSILLIGIWEIIKWAIGVSDLIEELRFRLYEEAGLAYRVKRKDPKMKMSILSNDPETVRKIREMFEE